ncbi:MAG TPA: hypothetical protein EYP74_01415 [Anaerolineales bacterium]|nr:hypothetical protein [Anaerolineales bacterium]
MKTKKKFRFVYLILGVAFLLSACVSTSAPNDGSTIDATQAAELIETAVAQALDEQAAKFATTVVSQATPTVEATNTAIPAPPTLTPPPTITPLVISKTATSTPRSSGGGSYTPEYACELVSIQPPPTNSSVFKKGGTFDIRITIKNTGTATWPAGYDLTYHNSANSTNLVPGTTIFEELPEVLPGETYDIGPYDGVAPDKKGHYVMTFRLEGGFCWPYVAIDVK